MTSNLNNYVTQRLVQKLSARKTSMKSSLYAGITISNFLDMLNQDEEDSLIIKVNHKKYDPDTDAYKLIESYKIKQEMVRKEFKEKIVVHLSDASDILRIAPETKEFKSTYGYIIKITIHIKTRY